MPPTPKIGFIAPGRKGSYRLERLITEGNMAWSLEATDIRNGNARVFLKYYKSPTPKVEWYKDYVAYVNELNKRLEDSAAARYCVLTRDMFTANPRPGKCPDEYFYQVYDFIEADDLRGLMEKTDISWEKRKDIAKVFLVSMKKIHEAGVVHCDLKPENVQMLPDPSTKLGLIPRMIDMDRSILADRLAPWTRGVNKEGYTGTPGYLSPEHLRGEVPQTGSDVFTVGLILGELLGGAHPFAAVLQEPEQYKDAVLRGGAFKPLRLLGALGDNPENAMQFARLTERCFAPDAASRPTCAELHRALLDLEKNRPLNGVPATPAPGEAVPPSSPFDKESPAAETPAAEAAPAAPAAPAPAKGCALKLTGDTGKVLLRLDMDLGRHSLGIASSQARYAERDQFHLSQKDGHWYISPCAGEVRNLTALNGTPVTERCELQEGDVICLMGKSSGKTAMELTVNLVH